MFSQLWGFPIISSQLGKGSGVSAGTDLVLFLNDSLVTVLPFRLTAPKVNFLYCMGLNKSCLNCYPVMVTYRHLFNSWVSADFADLFACTHRLFMDLNEKSIGYYYFSQNGVDKSCYCLRQTVCSLCARSWFCLLHWRKYCWGSVPFWALPERSLNLQSELGTSVKIIGIAYMWLAA